jgi:hypothetical protein
VKDIRRRTRKQLSAEEKILLDLEGLSMITPTRIPHVSQEAKRQMLDHWRYRCEQVKANGEPLTPPPPSDDSPQSA